MKLDKRNKLLLLAFAFALFLSYHFAIKNTIRYYRLNSTFEETTGSSANDASQLSALKAKEKQIDKWLSENNTPTGDFQNELLRELDRHCEKYHLRVVGFQQPHQYNEKGNTIFDYSFSVEGNFNNVLQLVGKIENNPKLGRVKHVLASKKTDYKNSRDYLVTDIILEKTNFLSSNSQN